MGIDVAATQSSVDQTPGWRADSDVTPSVEAQERLERLLPKAIYLVIIGIPTVISMVQAPSWLDTILQAILLFFVARVIVWAARLAVIEPVRRVRFDKVADKLRLRLQASDDLAAGPFSWTIGAPGAMAITRAGGIIILDRGHGYAPFRLRADQVADVKVEVKSQQVTETFQSGRTSIGGFGKSSLMAYTFGGRSDSVSYSVDTYSLEIRYQLERNGTVRTVSVPGGSDSRVVEELCATIRRLEPDGAEEQQARA